MPPHQFQAILVGNVTSFTNPELSPLNSKKRPSPQNIPKSSFQGLDLFGRRLWQSYGWVELVYGTSRTGRGMVKVNYSLDTNIPNHSDQSQISKRISSRIFLKCLVSWNVIKSNISCLHPKHWHDDDLLILGAGSVAGVSPKKRIMFCLP